MMSREELIEAVLADPAALWAVRISTVRAAGPWVEAKYERRMRLDPTGRTMVTVYPSRKPQEPDYWEFVEAYAEDGEPKYMREEQFEWAMADYEKKKAAWKPWSYNIFCQTNWPQSRHANCIAETKEEAMQFADEVLRASQIMLVP